MDILFHNSEYTWQEVRQWYFYKIFVPVEYHCTSATQTEHMLCTEDGVAEQEYN